jgi:hypothetical protein
MVGAELARRYLYPSDLIIGILGAEGAGKSTLIRGLFPGLELTNDDDGVNIRHALLFDYAPGDFFAPHTFHVDVRYELAFRQKHEIVEAVTRAVTHGRRVILEHFDLLFDALGYNAQILFALGEEIIVARPTVFGPFPARIKAFVDRTLPYRRMAHSAEDITTSVLVRDYRIPSPIFHSDVRHGFVINFQQRPDVPLDELEAKVRAIIAQDVPIQPAGDDAITIGEHRITCTGTRIHVSSSGQIRDFRLYREFKYHPVFKEYLLVGRVGPKTIPGLDEFSEETGLE